MTSKRNRRSPRQRGNTSAAPARRVGLARALSKRGYCSRTAAADLITAGRVRLDGRMQRDPEAPTLPGSTIEVDGRPVTESEFVYLMLNKPRGLVTTTTDERGRETVYSCFTDPSLPWIAPVGRLDKASEGLLLFTNDTAWAAALLEPASEVTKCYHVQIDTLADDALLETLEDGVTLPGGEPLAVVRARHLRAGERHSWLELALAEGRNRHIRRLLEVLDIGVLRLVRVGIGPQSLGSLARGHWRHLTTREAAALGQTARRARPR